MITQMKTYQVTCDACKKKVLMQDSLGTRMPEGWGILKEEPDMFGRSYRDYCEVCLEKEKAKRKGGFASLCKDSFKEERLIVREGDNAKRVRSG